MNEYLKSVFEIILPTLEQAQIDYWVLGGMSIAAYGAKFYRENNDVDVFIKNTDFEKAESLLKNLCKQNAYIFAPNFKTPGRPKIEIKIKGKEIFSIIPIFQKGNKVLFIYSDGKQEYPNEILEKVKRNLSNYRFFTSQNKFIKEMFINHVKARPDKLNRRKIIADAKVLLSPEERQKLGFKE